MNPNNESQQGRACSDIESRPNRICHREIALGPVPQAGVRRTCRPSTTTIDAAHLGATARDIATHTGTATVRGARDVAHRRPTITTTAGGDIVRRPGARWTTTLAAAMTTLTGATTLRLPTRMLMAGRRMIGRRGTSLPGMVHTRGKATGPGTMIGAVTGKSNHLLRAESLLNRRVRFCSATIAGQVVSRQGR